MQQLRVRDVAAACIVGVAVVAACAGWTRLGPWFALGSIVVGGLCAAGVYRVHRPGVPLRRTEELLGAVLRDGAPEAPAHERGAPEDAPLDDVREAHVPEHPGTRSALAVAPTGESEPGRGSDEAVSTPRPSPPRP